MSGALLDTRRPLRRGFTLVEIIVVIGIIVLLVGLVVAVIPVVTGQAQQRETENALRLLDVAAEDWEQSRDRPLTIGPGDLYDIDTDEFPNQEDWASAFYALMIRMPQVADTLRQISPDLLKRDDATDRIEVVDAWGQPIMLLHAGRAWSGAPDIRDPDETIRTPQEIRLGLALNRKLAFVSAGADGRLGDLHLDVAADSLTDEQRADVNAAGDNVTSYPLGKERPS